MGRRLVLSRWENDLTMSYEHVQWPADSLCWFSDIVGLVIQSRSANSHLAYFASIIYGGTHAIHSHRFQIGSSMIDISYGCRRPI